mmetsp:Transcript_40590/g.91226  ORF Transcript_40590/g.91226 Transcript_40590/m.91226 type:complete len:144 (-) Transcript_40590:229-660(-)
MEAQCARFVAPLPVFLPTYRLAERLVSQAHSRLVGLRFFRLQEEQRARQAAPRQSKGPHSGGCGGAAASTAAEGSAPPPGPASAQASQAGTCPLQPAQPAQPRGLAQPPLQLRADLASKDLKRAREQVEGMHGGAAGRNAPYS